MDDRRTKNRLDLQLICRLDAGRVVSTPLPRGGVLISENFSRAGILLRWLPGTPLPKVGSSLIVDVELPSPPGRAPRVMRCNTEIVRIQGAGGSSPKVALTIEKIRFESRGRVVPAADLQIMTPASARLH
jgi:hypothetical protein